LKQVRQPHPLRHQVSRVVNRVLCRQHRGRSRRGRSQHLGPLRSRRSYVPASKVGAHRPIVRRAADLPLFRRSSAIHQGVAAGRAQLHPPDRAHWTNWPQGLAPYWPHGAGRNKDREQPGLTVIIACVLGAMLPIDGGHISRPRQLPGALDRGSQRSRSAERDDAQLPQNGGHAHRRRGSVRADRRRPPGPFPDIDDAG